VNRLKSSIIPALSEAGSGSFMFVDFHSQPLLLPAGRGFAGRNHRRGNRAENARGGPDDTGRMDAAVAFDQKALDAGIKLMVGVGLGVSCSPELVPSCSETQDPASVPIALLAINREGYSNLCQLVTRRQLGTSKLA
jgi:hypothetical protein